MALIHKYVYIIKVYLKWPVFHIGIVKLSWMSMGICRMMGARQQVIQVIILKSLTMELNRL